MCRLACFSISMAISQVSGPRYLPEGGGVFSAFSLAAASGLSLCFVRSGKNATLISACDRFHIRTQLDNPSYLYDITAMAQYSTAQVAKKLKIGRDTLHRWLNLGLRAPSLRRVGGVQVRIWTDSDFRRASKYKAENYRKGRGRKASTESK